MARSSEHLPPVSKPFDLTKSAAHAYHQPKSLCVALQNEDPLEDAMIITKLDTIPFCCHEDLLGMSHDQLLTVALAMNAKLPAAMQISLHHSDTFIRHSVEFLVGLRHTVPEAVRVWPPETLLVGFNATRSLPASPLAAGSQKRAHDPWRRASGRPKLARLDEEEDEGTMKFARPVKRRKLNMRPRNVPSNSISASTGAFGSSAMVCRGHSMLHYGCQWPPLVTSHNNTRGLGQRVPERNAVTAMRGLGVSVPKMVYCCHPKAENKTYNPFRLVKIEQSKQALPQRFQVDSKGGFHQSRKGPNF